MSCYYQVQARWFLYWRQYF